MNPSPESLERFFASDDDRELLSALDAPSVPTHVAVIMDGNGRWASERGLPRLAGHRAGVKAVREIISSALELGVRVLTIYSFSSENWSRPADEVTGLMDLFAEVLERELDNLQEQGVRLVVAGEREHLPPKTAAAFRRSEEKTASNSRLTLVVALNYGGRAEIVSAVRGIASEVADGLLDPAAIDERVLERHLFTAGLPDPDLVIRTSGEMRVSNFLLWQIAYSELYVTDTYWPDFDRTGFLRAVVDYQGRARRFGGSSA